jgi:hypothetical protein
MSPKHVKLIFLSIFTLSLLLVPVASQAQDDMSKTHSVTGCLQKGGEPGGFYIVGEGGMMWELSGKVNAKHVGQKVTVDGHVLHKAKVKEAKLDDSEKKEAGDKKYADFQVTSLKMVSDSCQ